MGWSYFDGCFGTTFKNVFMNIAIALFIFGYFIPLFISYHIIVRYLKDENEIPSFMHLFLVVMPIANFFVVCVGFGAWIDSVLSRGWFQRFLKWFFKND